MAREIDRRTMLAASAALGVVAATARAATAPSEDVQAAFVSGFPLFEFARTAWAAGKHTPERPGGGFNIVTHRRKLTDPTSRTITTPNNDCLVSTARIDLSGGPLLLSVPDIRDRYFSVVFMDAFTDNFALVGTRATAGVGGIFLLTPPGWRGVVPAGAKHIAAPTTDVWMLARILINQPEEYALINALQDRILLSPAPGTVAPTTFLPVPPVDVNDPANFLAVANAMLARCPASDARVVRAARHADAGLEPGATMTFSKLDLALQARWRRAIPQTLRALATAGADRRREAAGWSYSLLSTGRYGSDDLQRAQVALIGLAALPPEEAFYGHALRDAGGAPFDGAHRYRLRIPAGGPPVNAFWSLTLYRIEPDGRLFLSSNPIDRYSIGDRTPGFGTNADGSLDILMQHDRPEGPLAANWLPVPEGPFRPAFRAYLAKPELLRLKWKLPAIERIA